MRVAVLQLRRKPARSRTDDGLSRDPAELRDHFLSAKIHFIFSFQTFFATQTLVIFDFLNKNQASAMQAVMNEF